MEVVPAWLSIEWWEVFFGGVSTLAIFSFLHRENFLYRFFEHFFIGIATAYGIVFTVKEFLWPKVFQPLLGLDRVLFPDGTYSEPYDKWNLLYLMPMAFGSLYYFILSKRHNWLAQLVIGFSFGVAAGLSFKGLFVELLPQLSDSYRPLYVPGSLVETLQNLVFVFTLFTGMCYFFFTFKRVTGGFMERSSTAGRWMLMGCFGAFFGSTIMARMTLLVERLDFLIHQWWPLFR